MKIKTLFYLLVILFIVSCTNEEQPVSELSSVQTPVATSDSGDMIVLGEKFDNPYSVENMRSVYNEMVQTRSDAENITIDVTDWYVRFLPKDSAEYKLLTEELDLELFDYPLDHDVLTEGTGYHDPSIPEGQITWQYTTVKPGFQFPSSVKYEVLDECFIPRDEDTGTDSDDANAETRSQEADFMGELEYRALEKVGYIRCLEKKGLIPAGTRGLFSFLSGSKPKGYIKVYDTSLKQDVPVKGIKVRATSLVKWTSAYTNEEGYYKMNSKHYWGPLYSVSFDNKLGFDVWGYTGPLTGCAIYIMGFHNKKGYDKTFGASSSAWEWATVNNAAYDWYSKCQSNSDYPTCPTTNNLKIWVWKDAKDGSASMIRRVYHPIGVNSNSGWSNFLTNMIVGTNLTLWKSIFHFALPDITIGTKGKTSAGIYEQVSHELAHASHFQKVGSAYWAKYISYVITYGAYGDGTSNNAGICAVGEMWGYAMGNLACYEKYGYNPKVGKEYWFYKNPTLYNLIIKKVLTRKEIFDCMTSDVKSTEEFKQKLICKYPKKAIEITNEF